MKVLILCALVWTMDLAPLEDAGSDLAQNSLFDCCGTSKMTYEPIFGLVDSRPTQSTNKRRCVVFVTPGSKNKPKPTSKFKVLVFDGASFFRKKKK